MLLMLDGIDRVWLSIRWERSLNYNILFFWFNYRLVVITAA